MAITVEDLVQLTLPSGSRVVGGASGLRREVVWARSLRPRPPAFEALEGGELALVSDVHLSLLEESMTLAYVIARLAEVDVAAVAALGEVDQEAVDVADDLGIPLIQLPPGASLVEVERAAIAAVVDRQAELQRRASEIHRLLAQLTFDERGLQAVAERIAETCAKSVAIQDEQLHVRYAAAGADLPHPTELNLEAGRMQIEEWVRSVPLSSTQPPVGRFPVSGATLECFVAPIVTRDGVAGYLSMIGPQSGLSELDRLVAGRGAAVCSVEAAKEAAVGEAEARVRGDLLDQLLSGGLEGNHIALGKAVRLGYDPSLPSLIIVARAARMGAATTRASSRDVDLLRKQLESVVRLETSRREAKSLVASRGDSVVVVMPLQPTLTERAAKELADDLRSRAESTLTGCLVAVGIGRVAQPGLGLAAAYREAEGALAIGIRVHGPSSTTCFGDLGILRLLAQIGNQVELESFRREMLGRLEDHDEKSGAELLKTLDGLFRCHGNLTRTAEQLSLHRNSLLYRLQRIVEISGLDMDDPETRLSLQVALKIRQLLEAERGRRG